jgi:hypothetical protein
LSAAEGSAVKSSSSSRTAPGEASGPALGPGTAAGTKWKRSEIIASEYKQSGDVSVGPSQRASTTSAQKSPAPLSRALSGAIHKQNH